MEQYKALHREADVGFEVYGKTLEELYQNAAQALFSLLVDSGKVNPEKGKRIDLKDDNDLLIVFLNELLHLWDTEGFIPKDLSLRIEEGKLTGTLIGSIFDPGRDTIRQEVKAVAYHDFPIIEEKQGVFMAKIVVDV
jgi:SHS2 domain-containing protein